MATNSEIATAITTATELNLTPAQMVALCDRAIAEMLVLGRPQASYTIAGRSITFVNLETARGVRDYYKTASAANAPDYIVQTAEF